MTHDAGVRAGVAHDAGVRTGRHARPERPDGAFWTVRGVVEGPRRGGLRPLQAFSRFSLLRHTIHLAPSANEKRLKAFDVS